MMASKLLVLGLVVVASLLLISSEVSARELAEETAAKNKEVLGDTKQYGYGGYPGRGYGGYPGGGYGGYPGGGYGGGYPPWRRPYCRWGCCGRGWYGGGCRCCIYPGQVPDAGLQTAEP